MSENGSIANAEIAPASSPIPGPPLTVLVVGSEGSFLSTFECKKPASETPAEKPPGALINRIPLEPPRSEVVFARDGSRMMYSEGESQTNVVIRDASSGDKICEFGQSEAGVPDSKVSYMYFSPKGTYALTWQKKTSDPRGNLCVWDAKTGNKIAAFQHREFKKDNWPFVEWNSDESLAVRCSGDYVLFYDGCKFDTTPTRKLSIPQVEKAVISPGAAPHYLTIFIKSSKSQEPSRISLIKEDGATVTSHSTFRADSASFCWSSTGKAVLAQVATAIDATGKSYYGESMLYYMDISGKMDSRVELPKDGPIHDFAWSPDGKGFIVIYGYMPARATLFSSDCQPLFDFGTGSHNTISFSPHGRFVALGGFGNLAGHVEFWDKKQRVLLGEADMHCTTVFGWSPDSRYFLSATTFPRLRVDNCYRIFKHNSELVYHEKLEKSSYCFQASFRPSEVKLYPDLPASPRSKSGLSMPQGKVISLSGLKSKEPYRPPGARGQAATFKLHDHEVAGEVDRRTWKSGGSSIGAGPEAPRGVRGKVVPGAESLMDEEENKPKKNRKKKSGGSGSGGGNTNSGHNQGASAGAGATGSGSNSSGGTKPAPSPALAPTPTVNQQQATPQHRFKALQKKLKQIEQLEQMDIQTLDMDQRKKLEQKASIVNEMNELQKSMQ